MCDGYHVANPSNLTVDPVSLHAGAFSHPIPSSFLKRRYFPWLVILVIMSVMWKIIYGCLAVKQRIKFSFVTNLNQTETSYSYDGIILYTIYRADHMVQLFHGVLTRHGQSDKQIIHYKCKSIR